MEKHFGSGREQKMSYESGKPQPDSRERLAEAISQEKLPKRCNLHPRPCWYDGPRCPACQAEREFKNLTRGMLYSNQCRERDNKGADDDKS